MQNESAVQFATNSRIHMGLAVRRLEPAVAFYTTLFGAGPTKSRPGYAKFEVAEPPVNLALNEVSGATGPNNPVAHFGIQVKSKVAVSQVADRLRQAGLEIAVEEQVTCCYAVQHKVWATDPDGNRWETYVVLDNDGAHHHAASACRDTTSACCPDLPAIMTAVQGGDLPAAQAAFEQAGGMAACACLASPAR